MKRLMVGFILSCGLMFGQTGSTTSVYKTIFTNFTGASGRSVIVPNIGQVGHQVFLAFLDAPGHTCTLPSINASLSFSYNSGATWTDFGNPTTGLTQGIFVNGPLTFSYFGVGVFPFVSFNITSFDNFNCVLSGGFYTGSTNSSALSSSTAVALSPAYVTSSRQTTLPFTMIGGLNNTLVAPIHACQNVNSLSGITAITQIISGAAFSGLDIAICSVAVSNTAVTAGTFSLIMGGAPNCSVSTSIVIPPLAIAAGQTITMGSGIGMVAKGTHLGATNSNVCMSITGGTMAGMIGYSYM